ncbi:MAG TPA: malate dehydrogenase [Nitrososphaeraceae archaeon]|nr:malate dehydrogenase [Nitrososphaeraceae archaeon]
MNITVVGSGKVGASAALNTCLRELGDVLLLDIVKGLPQGEALDINHQLSELGIDCEVRGSNEYNDMKDSEIIVLVAGVGRKPGMTRMDLLTTNANIIKDIATKIRVLASQAIVIVVTNPVDPMTYLTLKLLGVDKRKVMGMGNMLDLSRFKSFIHEITGYSRGAISAMVIGEHGENMLPLPRFSSISGIPLTTILSPNEIKGTLDSTRKIAAEVISLKGATIHAPGNAIAAMIESIVRDKKSLIPVSALLEGEYGVSNVCLGVPAVLGVNGIETIVELKLDNSERETFDKGVKSVKAAITEFNI